MSGEPHPSRTLRAPVAVRTIDVDRPASLRLARTGVPYSTALLVAVADGRPIGELSVGVEGVECLSDARLRELIDHQCWPRVDVRDSVEPLPSVSVVVATCARPDSVIVAVTALLACDPPPFEVIVVENRPADSPVRAALLDRFGADPRVHCVEEQRPGLASARNAGLRLVTGEIVAFTDDDVKVDRGWVGWIARAFAAESDVGCVTGLILPCDLETPEQVAFEQFAGLGKGYERRVYRLSEPTSPLFPFAAGVFGSGASTAVRSDLLRSLDGFDAGLGTGTAARGAEDLDLYIRVLFAGHALVYEPAAILWHRHPEGGQQLRRRLFDYGVALSAMLTKYAMLGYGPAMLRRAPAAVRYLRESGSRKNMRKGPGYSGSLDWIERAGMLVGPLAYGVSRRRERRGGYAPTGAGRAPYRPAWVGQVDVTIPVPALCPPPTPQGARYQRAWLLARCGETPVGFVEIPLREGAASARVVGEALARALPQRPDATSQPDLLPPLPSISVVVCTRDRPSTLRNTLVSILAVDYDDFELVVVDNAPASSATADLVRELADSRVRYVLEPVAGLSRARNRAVAEATGEVIAFTDDDVVVDTGWLRAIVGGFRRFDGVVCVTGLIVPAELDTVAQAYFDATVKWSASLAPRLFDLHTHRSADPLFPYRAGDFGAGANFAVLTATAAQIGGFDEALGAGSPTRGGEDLDFFARVILAGHTLAYEPCSLVWHVHRSELGALRRQTFGYRCGLAAFAFKHLTTGHAMRVVMAAARGRGEADGPTPKARALTPPIGGMLRLEIAGFAVGPAAYVRGRLRARRQSAIIADSTAERTTASSMFLGGG